MLLRIGYMLRGVKTTIKEVLISVISLFADSENYATDNDVIRCDNDTGV